jgi:hypothetical protein
MLIMMRTLLTSIIRNGKRVPTKNSVPVFRSSKILLPPGIDIARNSTPEKNTRVHYVCNLLFI